MPPLLLFLCGHALLAMEKVDSRRDREIVGLLMQWRRRLVFQGHCRSAQNLIKESVTVSSGKE